MDQKYFVPTFIEYFFRFLGNIFEKCEFSGYFLKKWEMKLKNEILLLTKIPLLNIFLDFCEIYLKNANFLDIF